MAKNLFVVNSSINLLSTFVLANSLFENDDNYLALVHPHGYDRWKEDKILRFMSSQDAGFKQVFPLIDKVFSKHIDYVRKNIKTLNVDNVFLGNDCGVQNQLLMSTLGIKKFYRLDDGTGSYYNESQKRSIFRAWVHKMKIYALMIGSGIYSGFPVNTVAMGESKAAIGDYLLMPELLKRYSPKVCEITSEMIDVAMGKLREFGLLEQELFGCDYVMYLGESITEHSKSKFSFKDEVECLRKIMETLDNKTKVVYKPHPNDKAYKLEHIKKEFPNLLIIESKLPVEFILRREPLIKEVIGYVSSTLIFAKKITGRNIKCVSLMKTADILLPKMYIHMLNKAGVIFREN